MPSDARGAGGSDPVFFKYEDEQGRLHIVNSPGSVPQRFAQQAERVTLPAPPAPSLVSQAASHFDLISFGLGFGLAATLALIALVVSGRGRFFTKALAGVAVASLLVLGYLGWLRRSTGRSGDLLATPATLVNDAKVTVERFNERQREQQRQLEDIERAK